MYSPSICATVETNTACAAAVLECLNVSLNDQFCSALHPVIALTRTLPAYSGNMLELHFDRNEAPFDFAYRINKDYDAPLLKPALLTETVTPFLQNEPDQLFQNPMSRFRYGIESICVEYDFPFGSPPALFFDLNRDEAFNCRKVYGDLKKIANVFQFPMYEELSYFLAHVKQLGLKVVYYGLMLSRRSEAIRLTIEGMEFGQLTEIITALGWTGNYNTLQELQQTYLKANQRLVLCVDFDKCLGNKLGIEVHSPDWEPILKKLTANGLCHKKQYHLLKSWYGKTALPNALSTALTALHQRPVTCIYRRLNHFKFVLDDSEAIKAKGYLYYCF